MKRFAPGLIAFVIFAAFYTATFTFRDISDTDLNSLQTRALVLHGDLDVSRYALPTRPQAVRRNDHVYTVYGAGVSMMAAPIYAVLARTHASERALQGTVGIFFSALAAALMFELLRSRYSAALTAAGTITFAAGTAMWPVASTAFYAHGPTAVLQILGLRAMFSDDRRAPIGAGLAFGAATFVRPSTLIFTAAIGVFYLTQGWRNALRFAGGAGIFAAAMLTENRWVWGSWTTGGYSFHEFGFSGNMIRDLGRLTFGWWRGVFVYSPVLLLSVVGIVVAVRERTTFEGKRLLALAAAVVGVIVFYSRWTVWWGGLTQFGNRLLLDATPALILLGVAAAARIPRLRPLAIMLGGVTLLTTAFGAVPHDSAFDGNLFPRGFIDSPIGQAWLTGIQHPLGPLWRLALIVACGLALHQVARRSRTPSVA